MDWGATKQRVFDFIVILFEEMVILFPVTLVKLGFAADRKALHI